MCCRRPGSRSTARSATCTTATAGPGRPGYGLIFAAGLAAGLLGLVAYERWMSRRAGAGPAAGSGSVGNWVSMQVGELPARGLRGVAAWPAARRLALMIAVGIGLHNFAEGLAIGQSAARSEIALATLLVIGFGLHNATEGFGIVAPLAGDRGVTAARPCRAGASC